MKELQVERNAIESIRQPEAWSGAGEDVAAESPCPEPGRTAPPSGSGTEGPRAEQGAAPLAGSSPGAPAAPAPGESARALEAYRVYLELGSRRRYAAVARQVGASLRTVKRWAGDFDWRGRVPPNTTLV